MDGAAAPIVCSIAKAAARCRHRDFDKPKGQLKRIDRAEKRNLTIRVVARSKKDWNLTTLPIESSRVNINTVVSQTHYHLNAKSLH